MSYTISGSNPFIVGIFVIDGNLRVLDGVFVVAVSFRCRRIPTVLFYHRTVIFLQANVLYRHFFVGEHRQTHDFPSVIINEDNLRLEGHRLEHKLSCATHIDGLEPVVLVYIFFSSTRTVCFPLMPWGCIGKGFVRMPIVGKLGYLGRIQLNIVTKALRGSNLITT